MRFVSLPASLQHLAGKEKGTERKLDALGEENHTSALEWSPKGLLTTCPPTLGDTLLVPKHGLFWSWKPAALLLARPLRRVQAKRSKIHLKVFIEFTVYWKVC